jgi:vacuolar-type H+-ATPase subunit I/STV1
MAAGFSLNDLVGGVTDAIGLSNNQEKSRAYNTAGYTYRNILEQSDTAYADILQQIKDSGADIQSLLGGDQTVSDYLQSIKDNANADYTVDSSKLSDYSFDKSVSDFLDPAADYTINKAVNAAENSLAGQGNLYSGGAGQQLSATASEKASELYDKAQDQYNAERTFDYGTLKDALGVDTTNAQTRATQDAAKTSNLGNVASSILTSKQGTSDNAINTLLAQLGNSSDIQQALAQLGISEASDFSSIASDLTGGLL